MEQKTALVTGASGGMGLAAALSLAEKGYHVALLCRHRQRGEAALARVLQAGASASLLLCDLGSMADIRDFCEDYKKTKPRLDVLLNNAGILSPRRQETRDGLEAHFGICHMGHFLLTNLLLDHMNPGARIVMVGSVAHKVGRLNFDDLGMRRRYSVIRAYSRAKLCNLLFAQALARRLGEEGVTVNCVHPGAVITNIGARRRGQGQAVSRLRRAAGALLRPFVKTPEEGAATAVYVATSAECGGVTGAYFAKGRVARASPRATEALAERLWAASLEIAGMDAVRQQTLVC